MARRFLINALTMLALGSAFLPAAAGHGAGLPWIYVEDEVVWPGQPFHVVVIDYGSNAEVRFEVARVDMRVELGSVETEPDGHAEIDLVLPADFPHGHAELRGVADDGSHATATLRVGDFPDIAGPPAPGRPRGAGEPVAQPPTASTPSAQAWWLEPSVLTLAALLGVAVLILSYAIVRRPASRRG